MTPGKRPRLRRQLHPVRSRWACRQPAVRQPWLALHRLRRRQPAAERADELVPLEIILRKLGVRAGRLSLRRGPVPWLHRPLRACPSSPRRCRAARAVGAGARPGRGAGAPLRRTTPKFAAARAARGAGEARRQQGAALWRPYRRARGRRRAWRRRETSVRGARSAGARLRHVERRRLRHLGERRRERPRWRSTLRQPLIGREREAEAAQLGSPAMRPSWPGGLPARR